MRTIVANVVPDEVKPRVVLVIGSSTTSGRPRMLVAPRETETRIRPVLVAEEPDPDLVRAAKDLAQAAQDRTVERAYLNPRDRKVALGETRSDQFARIAAEREREFCDSMRHARSLLEIMRYEAASSEISDRADAFFDHMCKTAKLDAASRTYSTLLRMLGTSEHELEDLTMIFWTNITVHSSKESSFLVRENHPRPREKRIEEIVEHDALALATERGHNWIPSRKIPVVRIETQKHVAISIPMSEEQLALMHYPEGTCFGETLFIQLADDRYAYDVELEEKDGSIVVCSLMKKGMQVMMKKKDGHWEYFPVLSDGRVVTEARHVGSIAHGLVYCDDLPPQLPPCTQDEKDAATQRLLDPISACFNYVPPEPY